MADAPLKVWVEREGALMRMRLARPKANVIDAAMIAALQGAFDAHRGNDGLRGVLIDQEGPHFSFGASVEEHLPESCARMLRSLHALVLAMQAWSVPIMVAVSGQCLGGGLEFACAGGPIFAAPDAKFGQPELRLGVFAPAASCLLPGRIGQSHAEDLLFSGRSIDAATALAWGLVHAVADDPVAAALAYFDEHLAPKSASSLRFAVRAAREPAVDLLERRLAEVERLYLQELMQTRDAVEGLRAFIDKRPPRWEHK
jgi:cyclohexa-1,5-dienecarbonyl-CoA hydratase